MSETQSEYPKEITIQIDGEKGIVATQNYILFGFEKYHLKDITEIVRRYNLWDKMNADFGDLEARHTDDILKIDQQQKRIKELEGQIELMGHLQGPD